MTPHGDIRIFYYEGSDGGFERCLEMNEDGSLIYWESPNRYAHLGGEKFRSETLTVDAAKSRWPGSAADIDSASAKISSRRS